MIVLDSIRSFTTKVISGIYDFVKFICGIILYVLGGVLVTSSILSAIGLVGYFLYIWWGVISKLDFLGFLLGIIFFVFSIPLAPIYIGINGNWEPTLVLVFGFVYFLFSGVFGIRLLRWSNNLTGDESEYLLK